MSSRKRIALLTTSFPLQGDGSEAAGAFVADFAAALTAHADVTVIAAGSVEGRSMQDGYTLHRFGCPRLPLSLLSPLKPGDWGSIVKTLSAGWRALENAHLDTPFDHVLALWALPSGAWARRLKMRHGVPYSVWALGSDIWGLGRVPLVRQMLARVLRDADHCFADGLKLAEDVQGLSGRDCAFLPSSRQLQVPPRLTPRRSQPPYQLAFLGRWHPNKGVDLLLEALSQLDARDWACIDSMTLAGGGPLEPLVRREVSTLQAAGRPVQLQGYLDRTAATAFIQSADILLLPSRIESIPVIFSDAMQCGTPLIAMPVGDLPGLMAGGRVGWLVPRVDTTTLAETIRQVIHHPQLQSQFDRALADAAAQFSVAGAAADFHRTVQP